MKITDRFSGRVLFELECGSLKLCLEAAVKDEANLGGADLRGANLRGAHLHWANLGIADLRGADLREANLGEADLRMADLRGADLREADLRGAYLRGADLGAADLGGAYLRGADLGGHKVNGDVGLIAAGKPNNWPATGFITEDGALRVCVGCRNKEIGEGRAYWSRPEHLDLENRREVLAALDYIEAVARLRGWVPT